MAFDALVEPLAHLRIFAGLPPAQLAHIVRAADRALYRPGDVVVAENQEADAATVIISGKCFRIDSENSRGGDLVAEGSIIAELAMIVEVQHASTIIAQSNVKALRLRRVMLREMMDLEPQLAEHFLARMVERLKATANDLARIDEAITSSVTAISISGYVEPRSIPQLHSG